MKPDSSCDGRSLFDGCSGLWTDGGNETGLNCETGCRAAGGRFSRGGLGGRSADLAGPAGCDVYATRNRWWFTKDGLPLHVVA